MGRKKNNKGRKPTNDDSRKKTGSEESQDTKPISEESGKKPSKEEESSDPKLRSKINDPAFYTRDRTLADNAGKINFSYPFGTSIRLSERSFNATSTRISNASAGIVCAVLKPSIGETTDRNSPANVAATQLYINVRHVNSGRKNYDQQDLFLAELAIADIYSFIMWCQRLYACAYSYSQVNWYVGKDLIKANHVDAENLIDNLAQFRYRLNAFISKVASFACPSDINMFSRRAFSYSGLWIENESELLKDQIYMFIPDGFYYWGLDDKGKGYLRYEGLNPNLDDLLVSDIYSMMDNFLKDIYGDEDFGIISGDIIKAYGSRLIGLAPIPEALYAVPTHDHDALRQFHNATIVDTQRSTAGEEYDDNYDRYQINLGTESVPNYQYCKFGDIYQDANGNLVCHESPKHATNKVETMTNDILKHGVIVDIDSWDPTPDEVLESTRLCAVTRGELQGYYQDDEDAWVMHDICYPLVCGADYVTRIEIGVKGATNDYIIQSNSRNILFMDNSGTPAGFSIWALAAVYMSLVSQFEYAPMQYLVNTNLNGEVITESLIGNSTNRTFLPANSLEHMHECCMLSLMYAPGVAKVDNM